MPVKFYLLFYMTFLGLDITLLKWGSLIYPEMKE